MIGQLLCGELATNVHLGAVFTGDAPFAKKVPMTPATAIAE
jgi:hypothetical protein